MVNASEMLLDDRAFSTTTLFIHDAARLKDLSSVIPTMHHCRLLFCALFTLFACF
jgi:hypothetical protein